MSIPAGVLCAAFTAFSPDGAVDRERTAGHARSLLAQGCDGVALLGTTGEASSLSLAERQALLESVVGSGVDPARLVPGTGLCSAPETIALSRHALGCGVRTVLLLPPFYYPSPSETGLIAHYSRVLDAIAGEGAQVILYHIPQTTGVPITHGLIAALTGRFPGVVVGVKDSGGDLGHMLGLIDAFPNLAVFAGADHLLAPLLRAGGAGAITATCNLIAPHLVELHRRVRAGETGQATAPLEEAIAAARSFFQRWPQIAALKAAHAMMTGEPGWAAVRPPLESIDSPAVAEMRAGLAGIGPSPVPMEDAA